MNRFDRDTASSSTPPRTSLHRLSQPFLWLLLPALVAVAGCGGLSAPPSGHTISGTVTGAVQAGVTITLTGGDVPIGPITTVTNGAGGYAFGGLAAGPYLLTAALADYEFAPHAGQQVIMLDADVGGRDFLAVATRHAIRGTIRGVVSAGVQIDLTGATSATATSAADGSFAFPSLLDSTYLITPRLAGHGFTPGARQVTLSGADATGTDFVASLATGGLHAITGSVRGAVVAGVTLTLEQGAAVVATALTGAPGTFRFGDLADGAYTVTPSSAGHAFAPHSQAVILGGADVALPAFVATASTTSAQLEEISTGARLGWGIALGNDLNAWITDGVNPVVSRVRLQTTVDGPRGQVTDFPLDGATATPTAIALRFFGLRCFTQPQANRIGCISYAGTDVFTVDITTPASGPVDVINGPGAGPLSPDIWFAEHDAGKVGRMSVAAGENPTSGAMVAEYLLPAGCQPTALAWTSGNVWWAAEGCGRIGWIVPATGLVRTVPVDVGRPISLAADLVEEAVWFVDAAGDRLGRLTAAGGLAWFAPRVAGSRLTSVVAGPDGALYVTQLAANSVARLPTTSFDPAANPNAGRLTQEFPLPVAGSQPFRITSGTDGNVWFTQRGRPAIGVIYMPTHCIQGKVVAAGLLTPVAGVRLTLTPAGASTGTATSNAEGDYGFCGLAPGAYTVQPSLAARTFVPASLPVTMGTSNQVGLGFIAQ
jgi:virginiamycin B lyase